MAQIPINQALPADLLVGAQKHLERGELENAESLLLDLIKEGFAQTASERIVRARVMLPKSRGPSPYPTPPLCSCPTTCTADATRLPARAALRAFCSNLLAKRVFALRTLLNAPSNCSNLGDTAHLARSYHCLGRTLGLDEQSLARSHTNGD